MSNEAQLEMLLRLVLAGVAGGILGFEREMEHKPAGIRTFATVSIGAALFTVAAIQAYGSLDSTARVTAQIVTGIGFLGAGTIIQQRDKVAGLTTAAGIWAVAAIGVTFGNGLYILGIGATLILFVLVGIVGRIVTGIRREIERRADVQPPG